MLPDFAQDDAKTDETRRRRKKRRGNGRCKWGQQRQHQQRNTKARVQTQQAERECLPAETEESGVPPSRRCSYAQGTQVRTHRLSPPDQREA